jgi:hypothetical protein
VNRVTLTLDANGDILRICADEPVESYTVSRDLPADRVYLCGHVEIGPQFVQEEIGGHPIGHFYDAESRAAIRAMSAAIESSRNMAVGSP